MGRKKANRSPEPAAVPTFEGDDIEGLRPSTPFEIDTLDAAPAVEPESPTISVTIKQAAACGEINVEPGFLLAEIKLAPGVNLDDVVNGAYNGTASLDKSVEVESGKPIAVKTKNYSIVDGEMVDPGFVLGTVTLPDGVAFNYLIHAIRNGIAD